MEKGKCAICGQNKGKRVCRLHGGKTICSLCCAGVRKPDCEWCPHYAVANQYTGSKTNKPHVKHFIAEINPKVEEAVEQALALLEKGDIEAGEAVIRGLEKDNPRNHTVFYGRGLVHALKEEYQEAIKCFDRAIDIFPYYIEAHFNKAMACKASYDVINMVKAFRQVVALGDPEDDLVKQAQKNIKVLEQSLNKAEGIDLDTYLKCGEIFEESFSSMEKGEWEKAIAGFQACVNKNKRHVQSYGNMGICYAQLGRKGEALKAIATALELDPTYGPALTNRTAIESLKEGERLGRNSMSVEYYKDQFLRKNVSPVKSLIRKVFG